MEKNKRLRAWDKTPEAAKYRQAYRDEHYERIEINVKPGTRARIDAAAAERGMNRTTFIVAAVEDLLEKAEAQIAENE